MRHLKRFNHINESVDMADIDKRNKELANNLYDIMSDFIDDGYDVIFGSINGVIIPEDIINKTERFTKFTPSIKSGSELRHKFSISISNIGDYNKFVKLTDDMKSTIGRLSDIEWSLYDLKINTSDKIEGVNFTKVTYYFSKPSIKVNGWSINLDGLEKAFNDKGLTINMVDEDEHHNGTIEIMVNFSSDSYNGGLYNDMDRRFQNICDIIGFDSYDYIMGEWVVYFHYKENQQ